MALHRKLAEQGMRVLMKTSGATGFHLYVPVRRGYTYEHLRTFAEIVPRLAPRDISNLVTNERIVAKRPSGRAIKRHIRNPKLVGYHPNVRETLSGINTDNRELDAYFHARRTRACGKARGVFGTGWPEIDQ
jgi:hypothetical protein